MLGVGHDPDFQNIVKNDETKEVSMNLYIGNLSPEVTEAQVQQAFEAFGTVTSTAVIKDKFSGKSRGFGFVEMPATAEAEAAIAGLTGAELMGQPVVVNQARPRAAERPDAGGRNGSRHTQ